MFILPTIFALLASSLTKWFLEIITFAWTFDNLFIYRYFPHFILFYYFWPHMKVNNPALWSSSKSKSGNSYGFQLLDLEAWLFFIFGCALAWGQYYCTWLIWWKISHWNVAFSYPIVDSIDLCPILGTYCLEYLYQNQSPLLFNHK